MIQNASDVDEDGEDLIEGMDRDYQANNELDFYEEAGLDNEEQAELNLVDRMQVDQELERQERAKMYMGKRMPGAFMDDEFDEDENEIHAEMRKERMRKMFEENDDPNSDEEDMAKMLDFEEVRGSLSVWLQKKDVIQFVAKQFNTFLRNFKDDSGMFVYEDRIHSMCLNNKQSLEVVFTHLSSKNPTLAIWLAEEPRNMLEILNNVAIDLVGEVYPDYHKLYETIFVRVRDLPV